MKAKFFIRFFGLLMALAVMFGLAGSINRPVSADSAGGGRQGESSVMTPQPTPTVRQPNSTLEVSLVAPSLPYRTGSLLKGSGDGVFYLTEEGTRRHIYNWDTFLAFGFASEEIIEVDDAVLAAIPLGGELTRLVFDQDQLYWIANGKRWQVNEWWDVVNQTSYTGVPATPLEASLRRTLLLRRGFENGGLLREGQAVYYFQRNRSLPGAANAAVVPLPPSVTPSEPVIDVPLGVLAVYEQKEQLDYLEARLKANVPAANVRQGPGLQDQVIGAASGGSKLVVVGRTAAGDWLQIEYQEQSGWVAASLIEEGLLLSLLPAALTEDAGAPLGQAEPAAVVEKSGPLQPIYCTEVPMRGFGQVWGDHPEIQPELGCPYSWEGGERGTQAAVQQFEHGLMVWLQADSSYNPDPVYVFFEDGTYQRFGDLGPADPAKVAPIPDGFFAIGDKFGKVYWEGTGARVKERLGHATGQAVDSAGAFQEFQYGRMFWVGEINRIFVAIQYRQDYQLSNKYYDFVDCFEVVCD